MSKTLFAENLGQVNTIAKQILDYASTHKKFAFYGEMGVGKTTLIKALCLQLGVSDVVSSPTFSIVNEYVSDDNTKIYHFDFYRISNEMEAYDLGYEEYFFSHDYCFIEWSEKISELISDDMIKIKMSLSAETRKIEVTI